MPGTPHLSALDVISRSHSASSLAPPSTLAALAWPLSKLDHDLVAFDLAVGAIAVGREMRCLDDVTEAADFALGADLFLLGIVAAGDEAAFDARRTLAIRREHLDDAAGMVAINHGHRPVQDFNAFGAIEVEGRHPPLAVRHRSRNTVGNEANAGHRGQSFQSIDPCPIGTDTGGAYDIDDGRQVEGVVFDPAATDDD